MLAKQRIDMITGNVNSYARILNGPVQLDKMKTFNEVAASIAVIRKERNEKNEAMHVQKKKD